MLVKLLKDYLNEDDVINISSTRDRMSNHKVKAIVQLKVVFQH